MQAYYKLKTKEELENIVGESTTFAEVMRKSVIVEIEVIQSKG